MSSKFWFVGTGEFAATVLPLIVSRFDFARIVTKHPTRKGRGMDLEVTPVEKAAAALGFRVVRTDSLCSDKTLISEFLNDVPRGVFVIDYGEVIKQPFLTTPPLGCVNIHPSMLPAYRGAAPVQRALANGESKIGVTVFRLVASMDAGPIYIQRGEPVSPDATAPEVLNRMAELGAQLACECKFHFFVPQDDKRATYAPKVTKDECGMPFGLDSVFIHNHVRAFFPWPGVWVPYEGKKLKVISTKSIEVRHDAEPGEILYFDGDPVVACATGALKLLKVQPEGKRIMTGLEWANGARVKKGDVIK